MKLWTNHLLRLRSRLTAACTLSRPWACHAKKLSVRTQTNHVSSRWGYMQLHASLQWLRVFTWVFFCIADCEPIGGLLLSLAQGCFSYLGNVVLTMIFIVRFQVPHSLVAVRMLISLDCLLLSLAKGNFTDIANITVKWPSLSDVGPRSLIL